MASCVEKNVIYFGFADRFIKLFDTVIVVDISINKLLILTEY